MPTSLNEVDSSILNPRNSWKDKDAYDKEAHNLAELFRNNFETYGNTVEYLEKSGPIV